VKIRHLAWLLCPLPDGPDRLLGVRPARLCVPVVFHRLVFLFLALLACHDPARHPVPLELDPALSLLL
jgi:hypothetical protein